MTTINTAASNMTARQACALWDIAEEFAAGDRHERARWGKPLSWCDTPGHLLNGNATRTLRSLRDKGLIEIKPGSAWITRPTDEGRAALVAAFGESPR